MNLSMKNEYPKHLYHKDEVEPMCITNKDVEKKAILEGWTTQYIYKEYPKWITKADGQAILMQTESQHLAFLEDLVDIENDTKEDEEDEEDEDDE